MQAPRLAKRRNRVFLGALPAPQHAAQVEQLGASPATEHGRVGVVQGAVLQAPGLGDPRMDLLVVRGVAVLEHHLDQAHQAGEMALRQLAQFPGAVRQGRVVQQQHIGEVLPEVVQVD